MRSWLSVLIVVLIFLSAGCARFAPIPKSGTASLLQGSPLQIRERLLAHIPIGTSRADASRIALELGLEPSPPTLGVEEENSLRFQKEGRHGWTGRKISLIQIECPSGVVDEIFCEQIGHD
jgi:hypothetical protein